MKAVNIVVAFVLFSIVVLMMFSATAGIIEQNDGDTAAVTKFDEMAGDYECLRKEFTDGDSPTEDIDEQTKRDTLDSIGLSIEKKIIGVLKAMENLELPVPGIEKTIKRLQKNKHVIDGKVKWYKVYVKENMEAGSGLF